MAQSEGIANEYEAQKSEILELENELKMKVAQVNSSEHLLNDYRQTIKVMESRSARVEQRLRATNF
jgi:hypothetical protein